MELAAKRAADEEARLLIVDTFAQFAGLKGDDENNAGAVLEALRPLQAAQGKYGLTVILVAHERKSGGDVMDRIRGANAMGGAVNQILSMNRPAKKDSPRTLREVESRGNYAATPEKFLVKLTKDGYVWRGNSTQEDKDTKSTQLWDALPTTKDAAKRISELAEATGIAKSTISDLLKWMARAGKGHKEHLPGSGSPKGYWKEPGSYPIRDIGGDEGQ